MSYPAFDKIPKSLLPPGLLSHSRESFNTRNKKFQILLEQRKWPEEGWDDATIEIFLHEVSSMDTNNFPGKPAGVGEREGRVYSRLVSRRCFGLSHGVGRSGDLAESQPKAAGSSLLSALTNDLILDFLQFNTGKDLIREAALFPMATGMTMALILLTLSKLKPSANYVIWLRHDQKSVFKSILTANLTPVIVDPILKDDSLVTNIPEIERVVGSLGRENILCIISTTSGFAPRSCDDLKALKKFKFGSRADQLSSKDIIYHVVNNAYGMQSDLILGVLRKAMSHIDLFIQSTDKNLLVPVGGCILASPLPKVASGNSLVALVRKNYPGRASSYPCTDVLVTVLSMGRNGWKDLMVKRSENYQYLKEKLSQVATKYGERVLNVKDNDISVGMSLGNIAQREDEAGDGFKEVTSIGAMLFKRNVTGARVVSGKDIKSIEGSTFTGWGAHHPSYITPYLTSAAALGMNKHEIDYFVDKLDDSLGSFQLSRKVVNIKGE